MYTVGTPDHRSSRSSKERGQVISLTKSGIFAKRRREERPRGRSYVGRSSHERWWVSSGVNLQQADATRRLAGSCHFPRWLLYYWHGALNLVGARRPCSSKPPLLGSRVVAGYNTLCLPKAVSGHLVLAR